MAINANLGRIVTGLGRSGGLSGLTGGDESNQPAALPVPPKAPEATPAQLSGRLGGLSFNPNVLATLANLPVLLPEKTTTQIAQGASSLLNGASKDVLEEAINTTRNRRVAADNLMNYLERKVKIGEVLSELAARWSAETKQDFAEAFQMPQDKLEVMDAIVSISVLNDPDLKDELLVENMSEATDADLLENRRIVWQYPPPGTVLQPPFLILLAVEHRDTKRAEDVIQSIIGSLVDHQGYKLPRAAVQKLTGRPTVTAVNPALNLGSALNLKLNT